MAKKKSPKVNEGVEYKAAKTEKPAKPKNPKGKKK